MDGLHPLSRKGHLYKGIDGMDRVGCQIDHSLSSCCGKIRTVAECLAWSRPNAIAKVQSIIQTGTYRRTKFGHDLQGTGEREMETLDSVEHNNNGSFEDNIRRDRKVK